jgi:hypothetical protein
MMRIDSLAARLFAIRNSTLQKKMNSIKSLAVRTFTASLFTMSCNAAIAGRPLTVDDANTNDKGAGHVEMWVARESGHVNTFNVSPAYGLFDGFEIAALVARDRTSPATTSALQAKWRITASEENGCNLGAVAGASRIRGSESHDTARYVNGLVTCNGKDLGSVHFNLGATKLSGESSSRTWGVAVEREFANVTPSVEWYGSQGAKPTVQVGLRNEIAKNFQLDGTVGRVGHETIYSVGLKLQF